MSKTTGIAFALTLSTVVFANDDDQVVFVEESDPVMLQAIEIARATLDDFLVKYLESYPEVDRFKLKVMIKDAYGTEHFWITPFKPLGDGEFVGLIANEPSLVRSVSYGDVYEFNANYITDWGYVENGIQYGSYTICALFQSMPAEEVAYYKENHGFVCENS